MDFEEKKIDKLEECCVKDMEIHDFDNCKNFPLGAIKQEELIKSENADIMTDRDTSTTHLADVLKMEYSAASVFEECKNHIRLVDANSEYMDLPDSIDITEDVIVGTIKQEELIIKSENEDSWEDNSIDKDITTTNSVESLKMENSDDDDAFEEKGSDIKLGGTNYKVMAMSDSIDTKDDVIASSIKQEDLMIKSENEDSCDDNTNLEETNVDSAPCLKSVSNTEEHSTIVPNISINNLKTKLIKRHRKQSKSNVFFSCRECDYRTNNNGHLKAHNLRHRDPSEIDMLTCGKCDFQTKYKVSLKNHELRHKSPIEIEMFSCGECDFQTKYKANLKSHSLLHKSTTEIKMFSCDQCSYQTKRKFHLKPHKLRHKSATETKIFSCRDCTYETIHKYDLRTHKLRHKKEIGMFSCGECNYRTNIIYDLRAHMLINH